MAAIRNARASMSQTALKIDHLLCGRNIRERSSGRNRARAFVHLDQTARLRRWASEVLIDASATTRTPASGCC